MKIFDEIWKKAYLPEEMTVVNIVQIEKIKQQQFNVHNYRPIGFKPNFAKTMNDMVKSKIEEFIYENKLLPPNSFGFRANTRTV